MASILAPGEDGALEAYDEELPEPLVTDPGEA